MATLVPDESEASDTWLWCISDTNICIFNVYWLMLVLKWWWKMIFFQHHLLRHTKATQQRPLFQWAVYYKKTVHKFQLARPMYKPRRQILDSVPINEHLSYWCKYFPPHPPDHISSLRIKKNKTHTHQTKVPRPVMPWNARQVVNITKICTSVVVITVLHDKSIN